MSVLPSHWRLWEPLWGPNLCQAFGVLMLQHEGKWEIQAKESQPHTILCALMEQ